MANNITNKLLKSVLKSAFISQQVRYFPRWNHRRPLKVFSPEEYEEIEKKQEQPQSPKIPKEKDRTHASPFDKYGPVKINRNPSNDKKYEQKTDLQYQIKIKNEKPLIANKQKTKTETTDMLQTVIDAEGNFIYTKMENNDKRVGTILTEIKSKKDKLKKELILLEGKRLIREALQTGCHLKYILFSRKEEVEYLKPYLPKSGACLYKMPYREMQMWSDLTTNPGIMGIFKVPNVEDYTPKGALPISVVCDNIREPGNLGTILRVCAGVGCEKVYLTKGCVNLWDTKVTRSSSGAHFRLQIQNNLDWGQIQKTLDPEAKIFIADNRIISDLNEESKNFEEILKNMPVLPYYSINFNTPKHVVLVIGGETYGISKESYEIALKSNGVRLSIPLNNKVESLNVGAALGVIAFEIKRQISDIK